MSKAGSTLPHGCGHLLLRPQAQPENFLRVAFAHLALAHGGLLLHASGLIHHGHGYVFFGHSGAGKSTVAGFAPVGSTLLSDDLVLLRLHQESGLCAIPSCGCMASRSAVKRCRRRGPTRLPR